VKKSCASSLDIHHGHNGLELATGFSNRSDAKSINSFRSVLKTCLSKCNETHTGRAKKVNP